MFLSLLYIKDIQARIAAGEWYRIEAQSVSNEHYINQFKEIAESRFIKECDPTEHFEVWQHPTNKLNFKKGTRLY